MTQSEKPLSLIVGTSGMRRERRFPVLASTRTVPALISPAAAP
jgi:hypothetical protein